MPGSKALQAEHAARAAVLLQAGLDRNRHIFQIMYGHIEKSEYNSVVYTKIIHKLTDVKIHAGCRPVHPGVKGSNGGEIK
jgi:hypothetical protein